MAARPALLMALAVCSVGTRVDLASDEYTDDIAVRVAEAGAPLAAACPAATALMLGHSGEACGSVALLRFRGAVPPAGAYVASSTLRVRTTGNQSQSSLVLQLSALLVGGENLGALNVTTALEEHLETASPVAWSAERWCAGADYESPDLRSLVQSVSDGGGRDLLLVIRAPRGHGQRVVSTDLRLTVNAYPDCAPAEGSSHDSGANCSAGCFADCHSPMLCAPLTLLCGSIPPAQRAGIDMECRRAEAAQPPDGGCDSAPAVHASPAVATGRFRHAARRASLSDEPWLLGVLGLLIAFCCCSTAVVCCRTPAPETRRSGGLGPKQKGIYLPISADGDGDFDGGDNSPEMGTEMLLLQQKDVHIVQQGLASKHDAEKRLDKC